MLWLLLIPAIYVLILLIVVWVSLHPPRIPFFFAPGSLGLPQENVEFVSEDGVTLRGWWTPAEQARGVVILSHGYVMNRCELAPLVSLLWNRGISCLMYDFRAHGRSGGKMSTFGDRERLDVAAAARFARARAPGKRIVLIGSSMGSAASALALSGDASLAEGLVLDSSYSRLSEATLGWWRFLGGKFLSFLFAPTVFLGIPFLGRNPFKVDIGEALTQVQAPVLVMHGECDVIALRSDALRNIEKLPNKPDVQWFENCGHSEGRWLHPELYNRALFGFLDKVWARG